MNAKKIEIICYGIDYVVIIGMLMIYLKRVILNY